MFCRYCGKSISEDSDFCTYCGKYISDETNSANTSLEENDDRIKVNIASAFFSEHLSLIVMAFCYIALGTFLFFNIKMAPFYGWWKFLAYAVEAVIAIYLTALTKNKISECKSFNIKVLSIIFSFFIILSSLALRIVYEVKVDVAEKDIPSYGTILVDVSSDTDYYSYVSGVVYDPSTSIKINGASGPAKITLGRSTDLKISVKGHHKSGPTSDTISGSLSDSITLYASDFVNGKCSITNTVYVGSGISATVEVELRRYCTFWEVIFY